MMATCASISGLMWCKNTGIQNDLTRVTLLHQEAIKLYYCSAPLHWRCAWLHEHIIAVSQLAGHASRKLTSPFTKLHQGDSVDKRPELQSKKKKKKIFGNQFIRSFFNRWSCKKLIVYWSPAVWGAADSAAFKSTTDRESLWLWMKIPAQVGIGTNLPVFCAAQTFHRQRCSSGLCMGRWCRLPRRFFTLACHCLKRRETHYHGQTPHMSLCD